MANDLTKNPWIVDTAGATPLTTDKILVRKIRWTGATTSGHTAVVKDGQARNVFESVATVTGSNTPEDVSFFGEEGNFRGLAVTTLASGKLYIYYG